MKKRYWITGLSVSAIAASVAAKLLLRPRDIEWEKNRQRAFSETGLKSDSMRALQDKVMRMIKNYVREGTPEEKREREYREGEKEVLKFIRERTRQPKTTTHCA